MVKINNDLGILLIRLASGGLMLFYGVFKLIHGHEYIKDFLAGAGLPKILWVGVPVCEVLVPVLLIFGIFTRLCGVLLSILILFTLFYWGADAFTLNDFGGIKGELNFFFFVSGISLFFSGGGKYVLYKGDRDLLK